LGEGDFHRVVSLEDGILSTFSSIIITIIIIIPIILFIIC